MQSPEQCINRIDAGEFLSVTNRIDGTSMTAAGQYDESFVPHIHHQRLIVMDERIGLPRAIDLGIVNRKSLFEVCAAMDLSCYQHHLFDQIRRTALFDELDIFLLQQVTVWSRRVQL